SVSALAGCPATTWDEPKASDALGSLGRFRANGPIAAHQGVRCAGYLLELSRPACTRKARPNRACPYPRTLFSTCRLCLFSRDWGQTSMARGTQVVQPERASKARSRQVGLKV